MKSLEQLLTTLKGMHIEAIVIPGGVRPPSSLAPQGDCNCDCQCKCGDHCDCNCDCVCDCNCDCKPDSGIQESHGATEPLPPHVGLEQAAGLTPKRKQEAILRVVRGEAPDAVAKAYNLPPKALERWRAAYAQHGPAAFEFSTIEKDD